MEVGKLCACRGNKLWEEEGKEGEEEEEGERRK